MENILHKRRIVLSFSLPFLFFIIISVLILNIAIWLATRITENNERQNCITSLSEGSGKMDSRIRDIQNIVTLLRKDEHIYALERLSRDIEVKEQYNVWLALQSMVKLDIARQGLDMLVYSQNADLVLSPNFMASNMNSVWGSVFRFGEYDHAGFLAAFCVPSYRPVYFPDMELLWEKYNCISAGSCLLFPWCGNNRYRSIFRPYCPAAGHCIFMAHPALCFLRGAAACPPPKWSRNCLPAAGFCRTIFWGRELSARIPARIPAFCIYPP